MSEAELGIGAAGGALVAKVIYDVVGPGAKNLGEIWRDFQDYRLRNLLKIGRAAEASVGQLSADSSVHPRVAATIIDECSWLDDDVMQAYAGGLLVSSRRDQGSDENAYYVRVLTGLTSLQTRLHYVIYSRLRARVLAQPEVSLVPFQWRSEELIFRVDELIPLLFEPDPNGPNFRSADRYHALRDAMHALAREGLIDPMGWQTRDRNQSGQQLVAVLDFEFVVHASQLGLNLFLRGHGANTGDIHALTYGQYQWVLTPPGPSLD